MGESSPTYYDEDLAMATALHESQLEAKMEKERADAEDLLIQEALKVSLQEDEDKAKMPNGNIPSQSWAAAAAVGVPQAPTTSARMTVGDGSNRYNNHNDDYSGGKVPAKPSANVKDTINNGSINAKPTADNRNLFAAGQRWWPWKDWLLIILFQCLIFI